MPGRAPIRLDKQTLSGSAAEALREAILDGHLKPGEWLRQEALAEEMGISQITVRDALNHLVGEGMAVRVPYKGVRVVSLSPEDIENICTIRGLLEGLAIELAAEHITPSELDQMRKLLPETTPGAEVSVERARDANREFHEIAIRACRRPFLIRLLKQLWDWLDPYVPYGGTSKMTERARQGMLDDSERDLERHVRLLEALEERDVQRARCVVGQYMQEVWEGAKLYWRYTGMFPEYFDED
jgi:DNA-binding GntR family transcriptional regulator